MYNQSHRWLNIKQLLVVLFCIFSFQGLSQAKLPIDAFSFYTNYNGVRIPNGFNDNLDDGYAWNFGSEIQTANQWSVNLYHTRDYDGYQQLGVPIWGAPLSYYDSRVSWASRYTETFVMGRLYTESNYYSKSSELRNKDLYGWYFSVGYGVQTFDARYWSSEDFVETYIDDNGDSQFRINSYIDRTNIFILDRGTQFGFGFKNFHTTYMYSDIMLLSSAYTRDNRIINSDIIPDSRRIANDDPLDIDQVQGDALTRVWARNGRGLLLHVCVGINLDFKR